MKILHIITRLILGGAQQNTVITCAGQIEAGHEVHLAYGPVFGPEGSLIDTATQTGAKLICIRSMRRPILPVHDVYCYLALRRLIRKIRPDIVHTHSAKAGIAGRFAAWHEKVPAVIHTIHGPPFHDFQPRRRHYYYVTAERWAARRCHKIIGVAQMMCDTYLEKGIGRADQYTTVYSGIDVDLFEKRHGSREQGRRELGVASDIPLVAIVARLDRHKGQEDLLDVMPDLLRTHPDLKLIMIGDGWHRETIATRIDRERLADHVILTGLVEPKRVAQLLQLADVKVLPSYREGTPRVMAQALAAGCAIVGYQTGGIPEICIDGVTGRLVPVADRAALADAIRDLIDHPDKRRDMVEAGRKIVRERFDHRLMVEQIWRVYQDALAATKITAT
jgi:glycosyltransferase involved in cell wall biosynthesis